MSGPKFKTFSRFLRSGATYSQRVATHLNAPLSAKWLASEQAAWRMAFTPFNIGQVGTRAVNEMLLKVEPWKTKFNVRHS